MIKIILLAISILCSGCIIIEPDIRPPLMNNSDFSDIGSKFIAEEESLTNNVNRIGE